MEGPRPNYQIHNIEVPPCKSPGNVLSHDATEIWIRELHLCLIAAIILKSNMDPIIQVWKLKCFNFNLA